MSLSPIIPLRVTADWLVPVVGPPIAGGGVTIGPDGRIEEAGPAASLSSRPGLAELRFAGSAIIPGLVNAHTHLELSGLAGSVEADEFPDWIRGVRELKATLSPEWFAAAARRGVKEAFAAGITMVLDTGDSGAVLPALAELGGAGVVYQEVFGPDPEQLPVSIGGLEARVAQLMSHQTDWARLGVSPHAPYTVSGPLYRAAVELARRRNLPLAGHLAESRAETDFVARNEGPFAAAWRARGIPPLDRHGDPPLPAAARRSPVAWLDAHGALSDRTLAIHAVQLDGADLDLLAARQVGIAHCPISNARHGHGAAPIKEVRARGIRLGVGTDSVISVGRLDLFAEMRAARSLAGLAARDALALGTIEGARLVGWERHRGWVGPGAFADLAVVALPKVASPDDVEDAVLAGGPDRVHATFASGRPVYRRGHPA